LDVHAVGGWQRKLPKVDLIVCRNDTVVHTALGERSDVV
jgi:hypothetical protein